MATSYLSPGVYVEEVDRGTKPIEGVGTAVAAFIGFTERAGESYLKGGDGPRSLLRRATLVTDWNQYTQKFGGFIKGKTAYLPYAVQGYFGNGGGRCYIISLNALGVTAEAARAELPSVGDPGTPSLRICAKQPGSAGNQIKVEVKSDSVEGGRPSNNPKPAKGGKPPQPAEAAGNVSSANPPPEEGTSSPNPVAVRSNSTAGETFTIIVSCPGHEPEPYERLTCGPGDRNVETVVNAKSQLIELVMRLKTGSLAERRPADGIVSLQSGQEVEPSKLTSPDFEGDAAERQGIGALEALDDVTMVCVPYLMSAFQDENGRVDPDGMKAVQSAVLKHCELMKYRFAILDAPPNTSPQDMAKWRQYQAGYDSKYGALYYPWISVANVTGGNGGTIKIPPCGHIAGIYARTDDQRGVHKAPANEVVLGALGLELTLTKGEQDGLNPIGINCLRAFPGRGTRVWGARTLSSDPSWRYVNVRRLFNYVEASIERGTQWVVFEPNDEDLWARVRRDVSAFLRMVWRSGALFGRTPEEAFYVKCDAELNTPEVRDLGQLIIEVGLAPVKPAEFVIFRISQWAGPNAAA